MACHASRIVEIVFILNWLDKIQQYLKYRPAFILIRAPHSVGGVGSAFVFFTVIDFRVYFGEIGD